MSTRGTTHKHDECSGIALLHRMAGTRQVNVTSSFLGFIVAILGPYTGVERADCRGSNCGTCVLIAFRQM